MTETDYELPEIQTDAEYEAEFLYFRWIYDMVNVVLEDPVHRPPPDEPVGVPDEDEIWWEAARFSGTVYVMPAPPWSDPVTLSEW